MESFATLIGQYNASALTLTDADYGHVALDSASRIIQDHSSSSIKVGDGADILDIIAEDSAYAGGEKALPIMAVRKDVIGSLVDSDGDFSFLQLDSQGRLRVDAEVSVSTGSDKVEDTAHATGDVGCFNLTIRLDDLTADNSALLAGTDGDYQGQFTNSKGETYVHDADVLASLESVFYAEDSVHATADKGSFVLGIANEALADLVSDDGDYTGFAVDKKGRQYTISEVAEQGTETDVGADEGVDGEVPVAYHATNFVDVVSIAVGAGETLFIKGLDVSSDKLIAARLVVFDDTTLTKVIRKLPITENVGFANLNWLRAIEVAGGANITVKLQARCMRNGKTANVGGGINAYK